MYFIAEIGYVTYITTVLLMTLTKIIRICIALWIPKKIIR